MTDNLYGRLLHSLTKFYLIWRDCGCGVVGGVVVATLVSGVHKRHALQIRPDLNIVLPELGEIDDDM
jgi:hypothetical protein